MGNKEIQQLSASKQPTTN